MSTAKAESNNMMNAREVVEQSGVELAVLLGIEKALRIALHWKPRGRMNIYKVSTLRFHASSFDRHLTRIVAMADHGGYLRLVTDANPHMVGEVTKLRDVLQELRVDLERIIVRLDYMLPNDDVGLGQICNDLEALLDDLRTHGEQKSDLLQHSFAQEEGGEG